MTRMKRRISRQFCFRLFALFAFNVVLFFSIHHHLFPPTDSDSFLSSHSRVEGKSSTFSGKPWPILPSFIPWLRTPPPRPRSCEAYFGNGFSRRIDLLPPPPRLPDSTTPPPPLGWFRCFYSESLQSSICEAARLRMDPARLLMSTGGESLESVIGRSEEEELPRFERGAFQIQVGEAGGLRRVATQEFLDQYVPRGPIETHTMRNLIASLLAVSPADGEEFRCQQWIEDTVVLVTRFEYANLFHTVTDWYSAYVASRVTGLPNRPHLIFLDGHCKSPLEETWEALFSSVRYAKNFTSPVCFRHAILSPLGYETALFKGLSETIDCHGALAHELWEKPDEQKTARLSEFGEMLRAAFGLPLDKHRITQPLSGCNVLFVRREDYLAHPRHGGKVETRLSNEQEVFDALKDWVLSYTKCQVNLVNGLFAHMPMKEQIRSIQDASVIIGAHGAGLTHILAASHKTVVLEIISSLYRRPHFALISQWRGLEYHAINLPGSDANPDEVIEKLSSILSKLGC